MCGIVGIFNLNGQNVDSALLERLNAALVHRGPDDSGQLVQQNIGLAMRRLAIIDLEQGRQPIYNEDKTVAVVFNGEIYNFLELRAKLKARGHQFKTHTDTEVIVHLYEEEGLNVSAYLNGMFAFALWDAAKEQLLIARDHLGIKPLYYSVKDGLFAFASELKALKPLLKESNIDIEALNQFLALRYIPAPLTIYKEVKKLLPAHYLVIKKQKIELKKYWDLKFGSTLSLSKEEWVARTKHTLSAAVKRQMIADVPLGAFLSGGLDSSIVVALMSHHSAQPVKTFSVSFPLLTGFDEAPYARAVAKKFHCDHHEKIVEARAVDFLTQLVQQFDEPMADPAALPTFLISKVASKKVKVVLTGEGGDELFGGYKWYRTSQQRLPLPASVSRYLAVKAGQWLKGRRGQRTLQLLLYPTLAEKYFEVALTSVFSTEERAQLLTNSIKAQLKSLSLLPSFDQLLTEAQKFNKLNQMQYLDTKIWLEGDPLVKVDRMTMATSLEARVPFLDKEVVELAVQLPSELKINGQSKLVLREAFRDLLPKEVIDRPKHGFDLPLDNWLRYDLKELFQAKVLENHHLDAYLNKKAVHRLFQQHLKGLNLGFKLWTLLVFGIWCQENG